MKDLRLTSLTSPGRDHADLYVTLRTLWRAKFRVLLCALLFGLAGAYLTLEGQEPYFTSSAEVALINRQEEVTDLESVISGLSSDQSTINTEIRVIRSRALIEKLVLDLGLISDPEFNITLEEPSDYSVKALFENVTGIDLFDDIAYSDRQQIDITIDSLLEALKVSNYRQSYVFLITATTKSPLKSALIANRLSELYITDQLEQKILATEEAISWLTSRTSELQTELEAAESRIEDFVSSSDLISPEALTTLNLQMKDLRKRTTDTQARVKGIEAELALLDQINPTDPPEQVATLLKIDAINQAANRNLAGQLSRDAFFKVIDDHRIQRSKELKLQRTQIRSINQSMTTLEASIDQQAADLVTLQQYRREAEASRLIYEHFLGRLKETRVQQGVQQADSRILSGAVPPMLPSSPNIFLNLGLAVAIGALIGSALVLLREARQSRIRSSDDLEALTGLTVMGEIWTSPVRKRRKLIDFLVQNPASAFVETIRNLRTSIMMSTPDSTPQVIMVTSSIPGEGKTTQALALAANFAGLDKRTLLIDADIRRRTMSAYFEGSDGIGLVSAVKNASWSDDDIYFHPTLGIDVVFGEKSAVNAADFFASEEFLNFLSRARERYDAIIVDTPPVLAVSDPRVIGRHADLILYVVRWDSTSSSQVTLGIRSLQTANLEISGTVLTMIDPKGMRRYGYEDYNYGSKYYQT